MIHPENYSYQCFYGDECYRVNAPINESKNRYSESDCNNKCGETCENFDCKGIGGDSGFGLPMKDNQESIVCDGECKKEDCCITCGDRDYYGEDSDDPKNNCNSGDPTEDECNNKFMKYEGKYVKCIFTRDEFRNDSCDYYEPGKKETIQDCSS